MEIFTRRQPEQTISSNNPEIDEETIAALAREITGYDLGDPTQARAFNGLCHALGYNLDESLLDTLFKIYSKI